MLKKSGYFYFLSLFCLCFISACGFHMRGSSQADKTIPSIKKIYIINEAPFSDFMQTLKNTFRLREITLVNTAQDAEIILKITALNFSKHSLNAIENQRTANYRFIYHIEYQILTNDLHPLTQPGQSLDAMRIDMTSTETYSQSDTELLLKNVLEENLALSLTNQITSKKIFDLLKIKPAHEIAHP
jgi:outer membrane lipopolysaccharide assembly protein LptE/RlpB